MIGWKKNWDLERAVVMPEAPQEHPYLAAKRGSLGGGKQSRRLSVVREGVLGGETRWVMNCGFHVWGKIKNHAAQQTQIMNNFNGI